MAHHMDLPVQFVGHPYAKTGKGEELRSAFAAYRSLDTTARIYDIHRWESREDAAHLALCEGAEDQTLGKGIRIFHINGDEIVPILEKLAERGEDFAAGYNIIVPAWELPRYPKIWHEGLRKFSEIWAISKFVADGLSEVNLPVHIMGQAVEMPEQCNLPRHRFGLRGSAFVFLSFLDVSSYPARKNPKAVLEFFRRLRMKNPLFDMQLIIKVKNGAAAASELAKELRAEASEEVIILDDLLSTFEIRGLIAACDCFISLHRSEGFGRGPAEAMWMARSVIATGWSGNMDYMADHPGCVGFRLVGVKAGDYIANTGQIWAEADIDDAVGIAERYITDPTFYRNVKYFGQQAVRTSCSFRAVGLRMLARLDDLRQERTLNNQSCEA